MSAIRLAGPGLGIPVSHRGSSPCVVRRSSVADATISRIARIVQATRQTRSSAGVRAISASVPSRSRVTSTDRPTRSPTSERWRSPTPAIGRPSRETMMSPARTPAAAAGLPSRSWTTSSPAVRPRRVGQRRRQPARSADDPEVGPPDPSVAHQGGEDQPRRGVDRHGQPEPDAGDRGVDARRPGRGCRPARHRSCRGSAPRRSG